MAKKLASGESLVEEISPSEVVDEVVSQIEVIDKVSPSRQHSSSSDEKRRCTATDKPTFHFVSEFTFWRKIFVGFLLVICGHNPITRIPNSSSYYYSVSFVTKILMTISRRRRKKRPPTRSRDPVLYKQ